MLTGLAMMAFAGNSLLCRMALAETSIDAASFTVVRMLAAAVTLAVIVLLRSTPGTRRASIGGGSWRSAITLVAYAIAFSYAYIRLDAATGALILFGTVQCTMIVVAFASGERPTAAEASGWLIAAGGLVALLLPGATAPSPTGALLMSIAGVGWGLYSIYGKSERRPLISTTGNFVKALPLCLPIVVVALARGTADADGFVIAAAAGSLTTGLGYIVWYAVLPSLRSLSAALVQLSVPVIAAVGGLLLLAETPDLRLVLCGSAILGGIGFATAWPRIGRRNLT